MMAAWKLECIIPTSFTFVVDDFFKKANILWQCRALYHLVVDTDWEVASPGPELHDELVVVATRVPSWCEIEFAVESRFVPV